MRWDLYTSAEKMQVLWVCIGLPVLLLAAWLVRDWMDAGGSKKARKAAKALGSKTDEMEHAISIQAQAVAYRVTQAVAYRVTQAGIQTCLYYRLLVKGQAAMELCALLVVSGMAEVAVILVQTFRKAKGDEEHPPRLAFLIAKLTFCAVLIGLAVGMTVLTQNW